MQSLPALFTNVLVIGAIIFIGADLLAIFLAYKQLTKRLKTIEHERDQLKQNIQQDADAVLEEARKQSSAVLQGAREKAQQIIIDTKQFQEEAKRLLETALQDVSKASSEELQKSSTELIKNYEASLSAVKDQDINLFRSITGVIEKDVAEQMKGFKETLEQETLTSQKFIKQKLDEQYAQVGSEIQQYKKEQLQKVDEQILVLLEKVTILALNKSLSLKDHQDLVLEALDEAKKQTG
jgi:hypothetical protein